LQSRLQETRWAASIVALVALGACAPKPQPIVLTPPPAPPQGIEGRYRGTARLIRSDNRYCPRSGPRVYEVEDGVVTLSYQGPGRERVALTAPIQPDGDFDISDGEGRLRGHIGRGALEMTIASRYCEHHWTMRLIR
jgi:hypothetical protein